MWRYLCIFVLLGCSLGAAENKGLCPPTPPVSIKKSESVPNFKESGTVELLVVISTTGYVCSAHVVPKINKQIDRKMETALRQQVTFQPAVKDGKAVAVVVVMNTTYHTNGQGEFVIEKTKRDQYPPPLMPDFPYKVENQRQHHAH